MPPNAKPPLTVVGTVALDSIETPEGKVDRALGGSAVYFAAGARLFHPVSIVGVVGQDFPVMHLNHLRSLRIGTEGIQTKTGSTFHWQGAYEGDLHQAVTIETHLNVLTEFDPILTLQERRAPYCFLANIDPVLQLKVLGQLHKPKWTACDTMNFWIDSAKDTLLNVFRRVNICFINDAEIRQCAQRSNLLQAGRWLLNQGPEIVIIKKGEHGALCLTRNGSFGLPAFLLEKVTDPTGAGDSFAGGFLGYLSQFSRFGLQTIKLAVVHGAVIASFNVESFSIDRLSKISLRDIHKRLNLYKKMISFR